MFSKIGLVFTRAAILVGLFMPSLAQCEEAIISSPNGQLEVRVFLDDGQLYYRLSYAGKAVLEQSPLGLVTNLVDYAAALTWKETQRDTILDQYENTKIKRSSVRYHAHQLSYDLLNKDEKPFTVVFRVSDHDVAFRYEIPDSGAPLGLVVERELTGFDFPSEARGFLTPQSKSMVGFARTKPSYEEGYGVDLEITAQSANGLGYTFPCLFRVDENWVLVSETGVRGLYCGAYLSDPTADGLYTVAYPDISENNGFGSTGAAIGLPAATPWRTITVGSGLKPIVETTVAFDVVESLYEPSIDYQFGKGAWSWIMWQDRSMNYEDQQAYVDFAAELAYEFLLVDAWWDQRIGYERMEELIQYAHSKNVGIFLWYNSNGAANDAPQTPKNKMNTAIARKKEMQWMQENGVKGIKVDFLGGDKQDVMKLYEDILSDANDYGLMVVFHGATLPRGWDRMFPNFVGSEAVLASENLMFSQHANDNEAFNATLHPFIRNAVASMEFGGTVLNKRYSRSNDRGNYRRTSDVFQLATAVLFQNPVQFFALTPNNLTDAPDFAISFMKQVPTTWDETLFVDGYPGKYSVLARQQGEDWYVAGVSALEEVKDVVLELPMLAGQTVQFYGDRTDGSSYTEQVKVDESGKIKVTLHPNGGIMLVQRASKK